MYDDVKVHLTNEVEKQMKACPVCESFLDIHASFCPKCGFERHILPEQVSSEVGAYEKKRIEVCKKVWEEHKQLTKNYEDEVSKNKTLEDSLKEEKKKLTATEQEIERCKVLVDKVEKELEKAKKTKQPLGIVLITDTENDFHAVAPINPGVNTFGSGDSKDNHHMVRLGPFSIQLKPKHFSVESIGKHLLLKDITGGSMNLPTSSMCVEGKTIKLNNSIEIKFLKIL